MSFFIKDPRIVILFPLYREALKECNININIIILTRNKEDACQSLSKVQGLNKECSYALYDHISSKISTIGNIDENINIQSEDIINDPVNVINKVINKSNIIHYNADWKENIDTYINKEYIEFKNGI